MVPLVEASQLCTIRETDFRPAKPQKLQLRMHVPPDLTQLAIVLYACNGYLELYGSR